MKKTIPYFSNKILLRSIAGLCLTILFIFLSFRLLHSNLKGNLTKSISTLVRNEQLSTNTYALSKLLADLELLQNFECVILSEGRGIAKKYYDTSSFKNCPNSEDSNRYLHFVFDSINGASYHLKYIQPRSLLMIMSEIISYIIATLLAFAYFRIASDEARVAILRIKAATEKAAAIEDISKQLAHDIRSPLTTLSLLTSEMHAIPNSTKLIVKEAVIRINDIANDLLAKNNKKDHTENVILLSHLIDSVISEKRIQLINRPGINLNLDITHAYYAFVEISSSDLSRVISNLLNNSIESFKNSLGEITVHLRKYSDQVSIIIQDNGSGIPADILPLLGQERVSYKKEGTTSGSGLGLYHAKNTIKKYGGHLSIVSQLNMGTQIMINLPLVYPPEWFLNELNLRVKQNIIILNDDAIVHSLWQERLKNHDLSYFNSESELEIALKKNSNSSKSYIFLIDYELSTQNSTGLDIIEHLNLHKIGHVVLVTDRWVEVDIQNRCVKLGIKILPKSLTRIVPIRTPAKESVFN